MKYAKHMIDQFKTFRALGWVQLATYHTQKCVNNFNCDGGDDRLFLIILHKVSQNQIMSLHLGHESFLRPR